MSLHFDVHMSRYWWAFVYRHLSSLVSHKDCFWRHLWMEVRVSLSVLCCCGSDSQRRSVFGLSCPRFVIPTMAYRQQTGWLRLFVFLKYRDLVVTGREVPFLFVKKQKEKDRDNKRDRERERQGQEKTREGENREIQLLSHLLSLPVSLSSLLSKSLMRNR